MADLELAEDFLPVCDISDAGSCYIGSSSKISTAHFPPLLDRNGRSSLSAFGGCTYFLTRAVGRQRVLSILLEGQTLDAETAVAYGLALELADDPRGRALELAAVLASRDPGTLRDIKRAVTLAEVDGFDATAQLRRGPRLQAPRSRRSRRPSNASVAVSASARRRPVRPSGAPARRSRL